MSYYIRLLYDIEGWAYFNRCVALQKYKPIDFCVDIGSNYGDAFKNKKYDLVLQNAFSYSKPLRECLIKHKYNMILVSVYTVGAGYADSWLDGAIKHSDYVIVNSISMFEKYGKHPKTFPISNGVDLDIFKIRKPIEIRKPKVLWVGSIGHRKIKNYDSIIVPLGQMLNNDGIQHDFRLVNSCGKDRMNQEQMSYWYNTGNIYIVASKVEGTPNPLIESSGCGCVPVSTRVGNAPELIKDGYNGYLCDTNIQSLYEGIKKAITNYQTLAINMQQEIQQWNWKIRSQQYYDFFRKVINEKRQ